MRTRLVVVAALAFAATACSDDGGTDKSAETAGGMPACSDVWVEGETLPADYDGCEADGAIVAVVTIDCTDGSKFTTYNDEMHARLGGTVETSTPEAYSKAYEDCTAD